MFSSGQTEKLSGLAFWKPLREEESRNIFGLTRPIETMQVPPIHTPIKRSFTSSNIHSSAISPPIMDISHVSFLELTAFRSKIETRHLGISMITPPVARLRYLIPPKTSETLPALAARTTLLYIHRDTIGRYCANRLLVFDSLRTTMEPFTATMMP